MDILFSCEHANNSIPNEYKNIFQGQKEFLKTHRGWDSGAFPIAKLWANNWGKKLYFSLYSRLLADLNRSENNKNVFSVWTRALSDLEKETILRKYHRPHWQRVQSDIQKKLSKGVLQIGIHSFTPIYKGKKRSTEIGILFDPARKWESAIALQWQKNLKKKSSFVVHRNRPYRGTGNGFISTSRKKFSKKLYAGFEVEINQALLQDRCVSKNFATLLADTFPMELALNLPMN